MANPHLPLAERLWKMVEKSDGCWTWKGRRCDHGYGRISDKGKQRHASRVAFEVTHGPLPSNLTVDHLCRNRLCCRPDHLEAVTNRENVLRGNGHSAIAARRSTCAKGHPYTPENTRIYKGHKRQCRICAREWNTRLKRIAREALGEAK